MARRSEPKPPLPPFSPGLGRRRRGAGERGEVRGRNLQIENDVQHVKRNALNLITEKR